MAPAVTCGAVFTSGPHTAAAKVPALLCVTA